MWKPSNWPEMGFKRRSYKLKKILSYGLCVCCGGRGGGSVNVGIPCTTDLQSTLIDQKWKSLLEWPIRFSTERAHWQSTLGPSLADAGEKSMVQGFGIVPSACVIIITPLSRCLLLNETFIRQHVALKSVIMFARCRPSALCQYTYVSATGSCPMKSRPVDAKYKYHRP